MKKLNVLVTIMAMSFMVGCGGGGSSASIVDRELITIFYHSPTGVCEDPLFQDLLKDELVAQGVFASNFIFSEETNNVSCATYNKTEGVTETGGCMTYDLTIDYPEYIIYDTSCVIAMDVDSYVPPLTKSVGSSSQTITKDTDIVSIITSTIHDWQ